jgi:lipid-A-disaccharide synthase-like uncharacterized protein
LVRVFEMPFWFSGVLGHGICLILWIWVLPGAIGIPFW